MGNTVYASFANPADAEKASGALLDHGVLPEHLSVVASHTAEVADVDNDGRVNTTVVTEDADKNENAAKHGISTTTAEDAGAGAVKGAGWGLGVGALAALAALFLPGIGLVVGGGALALALGGAAAATGAGAAAGALTGYLKDQGVEHNSAEAYGSTVAAGGAVLAVTLPSGNCLREEGMAILNKYGATNINEYAMPVQSAGYVA